MNLHSKICLYTSVCGSPFEISKRQIFRNRGSIWELCNTIFIYVNHAMPSRLASHRICELYRAIYFFHNVFHLSTIFIHSSTLHVHQPFESVMGKSGVKTRSSEQSVLHVDADFLLVTDSSSEEDSETDD